MVPEGRTRTDGRPSAEAALAAVLLVLIGTRLHAGSATGVLGGFTVGGVLALFAIPMWAPALREYKGARTLFILGLFTLMSGVVLSQLAKPTHSVGRGFSVDDAMLMVDVLTGIGVVLWSRLHLSLAWLGFWYGLGMAISIVVSPQNGTTLSPWKSGIAVALAAVLLSIVNQRGHKVREFAALIVLAFLSVANDSRSYFATFLLAAMLVAWQGRPQVMSKRASWTWTAGLMGGLAVVIYYLGTTLLVGGYLGKAAQARSVSQIDASGSLILGGRPELAATIALFKHYPMGFGIGVGPTPAEILVAKGGMASINYDPNNSYVEQFMFGGHFELHSTAGDIWAHFGLMGLVLVAYIAFLVLRGLAQAISRRQGSGLLLFLSCWTLWNVLFSPFLAAASTMILAVGLACTTARDPISVPNEVPTLVDVSA